MAELTDKEYEELIADTLNQELEGEEEERLSIAYGEVLDEKSKARAPRRWKKFIGEAAKESLEGAGKEAGTARTAVERMGKWLGKREELTTKGKPKQGKTRIHRLGEGASHFAAGALKSVIPTPSGLSMDDKIALYFGKGSAAKTGTTVATNPFAQLEARMATGPNLAGMMHRTDLSALRAAGAPPVVQDVYQEIVANGDVDTRRNVVDDMLRLGHSAKDANKAITALERTGYIERTGLKQNGSPEYQITITVSK